MNYKNFNVGTLFTLETPTTKQKTQTKDLIPGDIPFITRSADSNGLTAYCGNVNRLIKGNCITIGGEGTVAFYQPNDFVTGFNMTFLRHPALNEKNALYLCTVLNTLSGNYSYQGGTRNIGRIQQEIIQLPVDDNGQPDWQYMEDYIKDILKNYAEYIDIYINSLL